MNIRADHFVLREKWPTSSHQDFGAVIATMDPVCFDGKRK